LQLAPLTMSNRTARKIFKLNDEILRLREEIRLTAEELRVHEHLHDDAARDAAVSDHPFDREDERDTRSDVERFRRTIEALEGRVAALEAKRDRLADRLG
jgi:hypothetical protein